MDLSEMLAAWKARKLRQAPPKALLGRLEKAHKAAVEKIEESRTLTPEAKTLELAEARRNFHSDFKRMRREIIADYTGRVEEAEKRTNPPTTNAELSRMSLLSGVHLPVWQRSAGNLIADAVSFEQQGDLAGLKLARQHVGLLSPGQRSGAAASIDEALSDFKTEDQRKAELEVRSLEVEKSHFELASSMRERGIIAARAGRYRPGYHGIESHHDEVPAELAEAEPASEAAAN
jgi:hypothetical protein